MQAIITHKEVKSFVKEMTKDYEKEYCPMPWETFIEMMTCYLRHDLLKSEKGLGLIDLIIFEETEGLVYRDYEFRSKERL